jgi:hypothetical protein
MFLPYRWSDHDDHGEDRLVDSIGSVVLNTASPVRCESPIDLEHPGVTAALQIQAVGAAANQPIVTCDFPVPPDM